MLKFLHAADVHLDSPLRGLERYEGAPVDALRNATRRALENLVNLALDESVRLVLIAGDLYDGDWRDYNTGLFFAKQMGRLREAEIPVLLVAGNHDAQSRMTRSLRMPDNVVWFAVDAPETKTLDSLGVAVHGQGYARPAISEDLSAQFPRPRSGVLNIGLLHTALAGHPGHEPYAPCQLDALRAKGYDYWALGHVHAREVVCADPWIGFPGNIQGRLIRETGPKGAYVVARSETGHLTAEFRALDVVRWHDCRVAAEAGTDAADMLGAVEAAFGKVLAESAGLPSAVRVTVAGAVGRVAAHVERLAQDIRALANDYGQDRLWVEKVRLEADTLTPIRDIPEGPIRELMDVLDELEANPEGLAALGTTLTALDAKLPAALKHGPEAVSLTGPDAVGRLLREVRPLLLGRLLGKDEGP